jgi:very-short-patch-repair endonuclease
VDLSNVIGNWQTKLLQLDRRNSLLYFKERSSVSFKDETVDSLMGRLQRKGLEFTYAEHRRSRKNPNLFEGLGEEEPTEVVTPGDVETEQAPFPLQSLLRSLHRKDRVWEEEQGINVLFVALGFLNWVDDDGASATAPLLLVPADLDRSSVRNPWHLSLEDDDLQINETLRHKLRSFGVTLPDVNHERPSDYLQDTERAVSTKEGWSVSSKTALATFPFGKMAMWEDLERLRIDGTDHPVVNALSGAVEALRSNFEDSNGLPAAEELAGGGLDDLLPVKQQFSVLPADHSQLRAIELVRRGGQVVIHGPPGTGKSQTIANVIASLLGDGKRVLFVSEKTAALDVVKRRLEECELGVFCLDLHSDRARKSSVYEQLAQTLSAPRHASTSFPHDKLEKQRDRLNSVSRALHERRDPLGLSVFEVHGRFARVRELDRVDFSVSEVESLDRDRLDRILETTAKVARRGDEFRTFDTSPWRALRDTTWRMELPDDLRSLSNEALGAYRRCNDGLAGIATALGVSTPLYASGSKSLTSIAEHLANAPGVPRAWLDLGELDNLQSGTARAGKLQADRLVLGSSLAPHFGDSLPELEFAQLAQELRIPVLDRHKLSGGLGEGWRFELCPSPMATASGLEERIGKIGSVQQAVAGVLTGTLDGLVVVTFAQAKSLSVDLRDILSKPCVPEGWLTARGVECARESLHRAQEESEAVRQAEANLLDQYDESILDIASQEMLVRFRTDHQRFFRALTKTYRVDIRTVRGCLRRPRKLTVEEALEAVQGALELASKRRTWVDSSAEYQSVLGMGFDSFNTDWDRLGHLIDATESTVEGWAFGEAALVPLLHHEGFRVDLSRTLSELETSLSIVEADESLGELHSPPKLTAVTNREPRLRDAIDRRGEALEVVNALTVVGKGLWSQLRMAIPSWDELVTVLDSAARFQEICSEDTSLLSEIGESFGGFFDGEKTDWGAITSHVEWTRTLLSMVDEPLSESLTQHGVEPKSSSTYRDLVDQLTGIHGDFRTTSDKLDAKLDPQALGWEDWELASFAEVRPRLDWIAHNADTVSGWTEFVSAQKLLDSLISPNVLRELRDNTEDASLVPDLVSRRLYAAWLDIQYSEDDRLRFQPRDHEALRSEFRKLDQEHVEANRQRIRAGCFRAYPNQGAASFEYGQLGTLNHQLSLRRRQLPIRKLAQAIPNLLQTLKPCLLMSPVAVSQYLPRNGVMRFDVVVFDEASQVFPHDAIPAIVRAGQVVVVGDQKQLPPTSFFRSDVDDDESDEEEIEDRLEGVESILDALVGMVGAGVHGSFLDIHYRSRHEDLIRYSNHHFYNDRLLTFPSSQRTAPWLGIEDVYLPEARYDAGGTRTNRKEAEEVVRRVIQVMRTRPAHESLGVVTLSRAQADLIEELINHQRLTDSSLDSRFDPELHERFFVKNLENVQGDERDHIVLSIGYGPTVGSGAVPNRFGPINRDGGERRLNVAVSRARRSMTLVRSIRPDQITSEQDGPRLLRRYIEFAQDPQSAFEASTEVDPAAETESPFEEAVYRALVNRGFRVSRQVGCFGYRIDLAIMSEDGSRFDLGIECDGATYHSSPAARDRDWLRQQVLEGLGWCIHRIWSTDWIKNPDSEVAAVVESLNAARARNRDGTESLTHSQGVRRRIRGSGATGPAQVDAPPETPVQEADPAKVFGFEEFGPYPVREGSRRVSIHDESWARLQQLIRAIVDAEGPVHESRIVDIVRRTYGAGRAGRQIREVIRIAIDEEVAAKTIRRKAAVDGHFGSFLDKPNRPRRTPPRGAISEEVRDVEHIWQGELESGLLQVIEACFGIDRDEAITATARAFGFLRVGGTIREALSVAVDSLVGAELVSESEAGLRVT